MKTATKNLIVLALTAIASLPAFAFMASEPRPVASQELDGTVTVGTITFSRPALTLPEVRIVERRPRPVPLAPVRVTTVDTVVHPTPMAERILLGVARQSL